MYFYFSFLLPLYNYHYNIKYKVAISAHINNVNIKTAILSPLYISFNIAKIKITIITKNIILTPLNIIIDLIND